MGERGPKPIEIDWNEFDKLVSFQCTQKEIAAWFGISTDWLDVLCQRHRGEKLSEVWDKRKFVGKVRLRKAQFEIMEGRGPGAATMAIWLDKKMFPDENPDKQPVHPDSSTPAARAEKFTFTQFCLNAGYPAPFQKQIEMRDFASNETDTRMILGARGYGKTDYTTILGQAYDIYCDWYDNPSNPTLTILLITKTKARNTAILAEIGEALTKNGVPLDTENASCIRVKGLQGKDHSVEALAIRSSFRGRHPFRTVMDDPVTEEDVSEAMHKLVKRKYNEAMKLTRNLLLIGQPAHAFDLYSELRGVLKKLEVPHGQIPELDADLEAMKIAGVDPASIEMSYHLRIPEEGASIFSNLKKMGPFPVGPSVAFIDPSDGGDFTAMSIIRAYGEGVAVKGKLWKKAWYHALDDIVEILKSHNVQQLFFEINATGRQPIGQLREALSEAGIGVVAVFSQSNKHSTILAAGNIAHMIHLSSDSDAAYSKQVIRYEYGADHDDAPDSLARCLEKLGLIRGKEKEK